MVVRAVIGILVLRPHLLLFVYPLLTGFHAVHKEQTKLITSLQPSAEFPLSFISNAIA